MGELFHEPSCVLVLVDPESVASLRILRGKLLEPILRIYTVIPITPPLNRSASHCILSSLITQLYPIYAIASEYCGVTIDWAVELGNWGIAAQ